jgi:hypothetical protein
VLAGALLVGSLLTVVVGRTVLATDQVRLATVQAQVAADQVTTSQLEVTVTAGEAPPRISYLAQGVFHMTAPTAQVQQLAYVPLDKPLGAPVVTPDPAASTTAGSTTGSAATGSAATGSTTTAPTATSGT